jgi:FkbM family methyltransferase
MKRVNTTTIYRKCDQKALQIMHVCEVGVYKPETSNVLDFTESGCIADLVEADPDNIELIKQRFSGYNNVRIHGKAVYNREGRVKLSRAEASTFISELEKSPALINDSYVRSSDNEFEADCVLFSSIDDGTIDLLSIDIEGAEWYVLSEMLSRPKVISIETHGKYYTNPFLPQIHQFMIDSGYNEWYLDSSDTVYLHSSAGKVSMLEKLSITYMKIKIYLRKLKRYFRYSA